MSKKYTIVQFERLEYVTDKALAEGHKLVTMNGDVTWYHVVDTPRGKVMLYEEKEPTGFVLMKHVEMRYIHHNHRLAPNPITVFDRTMALMDGYKVLHDLGRIRLNED